MKSVTTPIFKMRSDSETVHMLGNPPFLHSGHFCIFSHPNILFSLIQNG